MKVKLLSDITGDVETFLEGSIADVEEAVAKHWIELGAAVKADVAEDLGTGEVAQPQPPLAQDPTTVPVQTVPAPTEPVAPVETQPVLPPTEPPVEPTPASLAPNPVQGQPTAADIAATLAGTDHSSTQPETPPAA